MSEGNVRVVCRFRPLNEKEKQMEGNLCVRFSDSQTAELAGPNGPMKFLFDKVFTPDASQQDIYMDSGHMIAEAITDGFNGTVFAYGQTSSGKTFTMTGPDIENPAQMGIIPRMVSDIFQHIEESDETTEYTVKVAYSEIYLEKIRDLLDPSKTDLKIHEDRTRGVYIADLTEVYVSSQEEVYELMKKGTSNREVAYTHMNAGSSRSHAIFVLTLSQTNTLDYSAKTGKLYLVDLAGSEKVGKTGAEGMRLEEAKKINVSLTNLGLVIFSLTDGKSSHVPYRNSKLTRILQDSLGGNSKTCLIVTCSPSPFNHAETLSTLRFGVRAKAIKNKPKVNKEYTVAELKLLLAQAKEEIDKRDRAIRKLEKLLKDNNVAIVDTNEEVPEEEPLQDVEAYNEVILELEETRNRLSDEVHAHKIIKDQFQDLLREHASMSEEFQNLYQICNVQKETIEQCKDSNNEAEEMLEQLRNTKESLLSELSKLNENKLHLETLNNKQKVEIEQLKVELQINQKDILLLSKKNSDLSFSGIEDLEIHPPHKTNRHTKSVDISNFLVSSSQDVEILAIKNNATIPRSPRGPLSCSYGNIGSLVSLEDINDESITQELNKSLALEKKKNDFANIGSSFVESLGLGKKKSEAKHSERRASAEGLGNPADDSAKINSSLEESLENELRQNKDGPVERKISIEDFEKVSKGHSSHKEPSPTKECKNVSDEKLSVRVLDMDSADSSKALQKDLENSEIDETLSSQSENIQKQENKPRKFETEKQDSFYHKPELHQRKPSKNEISQQLDTFSHNPEPKENKHNPDDIPRQHQHFSDKPAISRRQENQHSGNELAKKEESLNRFIDKYKKLKDLYLIAIERLSEGDIALINKNDMLQRNLEQLTLMYHQLSSQISVLKVDKSVNEKKINRLIEKNKKIEGHVKGLETKLEEAEARCTEIEFGSEGRNSICMPTNSSGAMNISKNIKKTIKGGRQSVAIRDIIKRSVTSIRNL